MIFSSNEDSCKHDPHFPRYYTMISLCSIMVRAQESNAASHRLIPCVRVYYTMSASLSFSFCCHKKRVIAMEDLMRPLRFFKPLCHSISGFHPSKALLPVWLSALRLPLPGSLSSHFHGDGRSKKGSLPLLPLPRPHGVRWLRP